MAVRKILEYPKEKDVLRAESDSIRSFSRHTRRLIVDLKDTLLVHQNGIGLAAPQIDVLQRVVIVRLEYGKEEDHSKSPPIALVNPIIIESGNERRDFDGCLSFPGLYGETIRPHYLRVTGLDEDGKPFDRIFSGFDAVVVHHEIDHLNGVLFIDRIKCMDDLYRYQIDSSGRPIQMPLSQIVRNWKGEAIELFE